LQELPNRQWRCVTGHAHLPRIWVFYCRMSHAPEMH
jgi:hypothetical protein